MTNIYIDTNIIVYALEDSENPYGKDISSSSSELLWEAISCKYNVVISTWTLTELSRIRSLGQASMLFKLLEKKTIVQEYTEEDVEQAKRQNPEHFQDELHAILALKSKSKYLVTRNVDDFNDCENKIEVVKPENLLNSRKS